MIKSNAYLPKSDESLELVTEARKLKDVSILDELSRPEPRDSWGDVIVKESIRRILLKLIAMKETK